MEPSPAESFIGCLRVFIVALHDDVTAHDDFPENLPVSGHVPQLIVDYTQTRAAGDMRHALQCFDFSTLDKFFGIPLLSPLAKGEWAI